MTTNPRHYPGMLPNSGIEFFNYESEDISVSYVIENGQVKPFEDLSYFNLQLLRTVIESDPAVKHELLEMHPDCEMSQIKQFAICRFGGLDTKADIINGQMQDGEYWACPLRGSCKSEGILCKLPNYNGVALTKSDVALMQHTSSEKTNEVIAGDMHLRMGTFHQTKKILYEKLGVQTKQEVAQISIFLNLI